MEKLLNQIIEENSVSYKIRNNLKTLYHRTFETVEETLEQLEKDFESLENGNYVFSSGTIGKFRDSKVTNLNFRKSNINLKPQNTKIMDFDLDKIKREAYEQGYKDAQIKILEKRVDTLEKRVDTLVKILNEKLDELDGEKDNDFLDKVGKLASTLGDAKEVMAGFNN